MNLKGFLRNRWTKFIFWALLYVLWVIWLGNYWWLFGLVVIFDGYITRKVKWAFWKKTYKEGEKKSAANEWLDSIIFAVIAVTFINIFFFQAFKIPSSSMESTLFTGDHLFVSKLTYGPRIPQTPLTVPFTHNSIFGKESYSTLIQNDYMRLKGMRTVKRGDCVVFNFPNGDSVLKKAPVDDYYTLCRLFGRERVIREWGPVIVRPSDKTDHYVKRCVALPGDTLEVKEGLVWVNGEKQEVWPGVQLSYRVRTDGSRINEKTLKKIGLNTGELFFEAQYPGYPSMSLTASMLEKVKALNVVQSVEPNFYGSADESADSYQMVFPYTAQSGWTRDFFGPLWIPSKGSEVALTPGNLPLYERIIRDYEHHSLDVTEDGTVMIDGRESTSYVFGQDYYFMMGDNRHNSLDSRYWGFVPEDHIVGTPAVIWLSTDSQSGKKFPFNVRWRRFFKFV